MSSPHKSICTSRHWLAASVFVLSQNKSNKRYTTLALGDSLAHDIKLQNQELAKGSDTKAWQHPLHQHLGGVGPKTFQKLVRKLLIIHQFQVLSLKIPCPLRPLHHPRQTSHRNGKTSSSLKRSGALGSAEYALRRFFLPSIPIQAAYSTHLLLRTYQTIRRQAGLSGLASVKGPLNMYMKGVCSLGGMQILPMEREIIGSVLPAASAIGWRE